MPPQRSGATLAGPMGERRSQLGRNRLGAGSGARRSPMSAESHLAAIVESSDDAILSKDPRGVITTWNPGAERLYGYPAEEVVGRPISILIPPHRAGEERSILELIMAGRRVDHYETERMRKDGRLLTVSLTISPVNDSDGAIVGASVVARDITLRKRAQERAERLGAVGFSLADALSPSEVIDVALGEVLPALDADAATVALVSADGRVLELAGSAGYSEEGLRGWERFPVEADLPLSEAVRTREPVWTTTAEELARRYPALAGADVQFASLASVPLMAEGRAMGGIALSFSRERSFTPEDRSFIVSVAQQTAGALERGRLYDREQRARAEAELARERLEFLSGASEVLAESLDLDEILQRVSNMAVPRIADWCAVDLRDEDGKLQQVAVAHVEPEKVELARELRRRYPPDPDAETGVPAVMRTGRPEVYAEVTDEMVAAAARDEGHLRLLRELQLGSAMAVPLTARGRTFGAISLVTSRARDGYDEDDLAFAEDLARRAALAVDNSMLYREEHRAAITLQRSLLPAVLPRMGWVELAARYLPAGRGIEVGGDWYDAVDLDDKLVVAVGDVAGRGLNAASVMGQLRNGLRAYAFDGRSPTEAVERLNKLATASDGADMTTLLYLVVDRGTGQLEYVRAGHPPALLRVPDGTVARLDEVGSPPVGVFPGARYSSSSRTLAPESLVLLYTDGLVERRDSPIEGQIRRLEDALGEAPPELEACCDFLLESLGVDDSANDDTALLAFRVQSERPVAGGAMPPEHAELPGSFTPPAPPEPFRLEMPAELGILRKVRQELARWLAGAGLGHRETHAVVTACNEACANAAEHAYPRGSLGPLRVEAVLQPDGIEVSVRDFGSWREPMPTRGRESERGRGYTLMNGLMDRVHVSRSPAGTEVTITCRLASGSMD